MPQKIHHRHQIKFKFNVKYEVNFEEEIYHIDDIVFRWNLEQKNKQLKYVHIANTFWTKQTDLHQ